jgi:hypothetical protein
MARNGSGEIVTAPVIMSQAAPGIRSEGPHERQHSNVATPSLAGDSVSRVAALGKVR